MSVLRSDWSTSTVQSIIQKWKKCSTTANLPRYGRPRKLSDQARRALVREAAKRPMVTLEELHIHRSGVLFSRISGAEVEMRVRPGDNVTLYSDCVRESGTSVVWFRKSSDEDQTPLIISGGTLGKGAYSCCALVRNPSLKTSDLLVRNVSESDLGLYYCAVWERKSIKGVQRDVYHNGTRTTRLSILVVSSTCVYCIYRKRPEAVKEKNQREREKSPNQQIRTREEVGGGDVCYASLDLPSRGQKPLKKKKRRVESSEFSPYSE
ncbi:hypothetical protein NFI96_009126, partial [Prochilodus magdalenae]